MSAITPLANCSANSSATWVVFTGKLPAETKKRLKIASAQTGIKQQEIVAEAVEQWMKLNGIGKVL